MVFNQYPYLNLNDLNLDYILNEIKSMYNDVTNFVSINAIKYADPIQWDITRQYEKNTIVIDPLSGTAYISVAPVPAGVALTRPEYWTVVFDLSMFIVRAAQNFTSHVESDTTLTATFASNTGDWIVWGDVLYKALVPITAGDQYVIGSNIDHFTIEDLYNAYLNTIATILGMIGDLDNLNTTNKDSLVDAINEIDILNVISTSFADLLNISSRVGMGVLIDNVAGKFVISDTPPLTGLYYTLNDGNYAVYYPSEYIDFAAYNPSRVSDCSTELQAAILDAHDLGLPLKITGLYQVDNAISIPQTTKIIGDNSAILDFTNYSTAAPAIEITSENRIYNDTVILENVILQGNSNIVTGPNHYPTNEFSSAYGLKVSANHVTFKNVTIRNFERGIMLGDHGYCIYCTDCRILWNDYGIYFDTTALNDAGGLTIFDRCSIAGNITGIHNVISNVQFNHCNIDYNYVADECQMTSGGIVAGYEIFSNCQIECGDDAAPIHFKDIGTPQASARIFGDCLFMIRTGVDGFFTLNANATLNIHDCYIRASINSDLKDPEKYLIVTGNENNVLVDVVRLKWYDIAAGAFRLCKSENKLKVNRKGFNATDATITYSGDNITLENTSTTQGKAEIIINRPAGAKILFLLTTINANYSNTIRVIQYDGYNKDDERIDYLYQNQTFTSGVDYQYTVGGWSMNDQVEKIKITFLTPKAGTIDGVTPANITFKDAYVYFAT